MGYSHSEIGHNWAHQLKKRQSTNSFSFEGTRIYSYGTVIGEIAELSDGTKVYLLNTGSYSNSTAKHQNHAFGAIPNDAIKFSVSCDDFIYGWRGYYWEKFTQATQTRLVHKYLGKMFEIVKGVIESSSIKNENEWSTKWYSEAVRLVELTKCTTISKLSKETVSEIVCHYNLKKNDATAFRKMVVALYNNITDIKGLVNATFGEGKYEEYVKRTSGARMGRRTMMLNRMLGFRSLRESAYRAPVCYAPYHSEWGRHMTFATKNTGNFKRHTYPRSLGYLQHEVHCHRTDGSITANDIRKHEKAGDYLQWLYNLKRKTLAYNRDVEENNRRNDRMLKAKSNLERFIGFSGWLTVSTTYSYRKVLNPNRLTYNYNGVEFAFETYHTERKLTPAEYYDYVQLDAVGREAWIREKKDWMLRTLQDETMCHEQDLREREEWQRILEERAAERKEKALYIAEKRKEGVTGIRQLFHEGLVDAGYNEDRSLYYGGNALLRFDKRENLVITSKGIKVTIPECERLWKIVSYWHTHDVTFVKSDEVVRATTNNWNISRFQDDIMIAGCHAIHYNEMELMAKELGFYKEAA